MQEEEYSTYVGFKEVFSIAITILNRTELVIGLDIEGQTKRLEALKSHSANKLEIKNDLLHNKELIVHTRPDLRNCYSRF